jgi:hypothetical protein
MLWNASLALQGYATAVCIRFVELQLHPGLLSSAALQTLLRLQQVVHVQVQLQQSLISNDTVQVLLGTGDQIVVQILDIRPSKQTQNSTSSRPLLIGADNHLQHEGCMHQQFE